MREVTSMSGGMPITQKDMAESLLQRFLKAEQSGVTKLPSE